MNEDEHRPQPIEEEEARESAIGTVRELAETPPEAPEEGPEEERPEERPEPESPIEEPPSEEPEAQEPAGGGEPPETETESPPAEPEASLPGEAGTVKQEQAVLEDAADHQVTEVEESGVPPAEETALHEEPEPAAPAEEAPAEEAPVEEAPVEEVEEPPPSKAPAQEAPAEEAEARARDPLTGPGDWYVIHTYAGYENKVKTNLESRIQTMQMQDRIFDVVIPMEDVMEIKGGRKQVVQKKKFPGYLLVKMVYDDDSWYVVRNTPGVTGFVSSGTGQKPTPLSRNEVGKMLVVKEEEAKPAFRLEFEVNDVVRITQGPFADFNGTISEINVDQSKVKVLVSIFDRETPVELGFDQVAKV